MKKANRTASLGPPDITLKRIIVITMLMLPFFARALTCTALTGVRAWNLASTWTSGGNCNRIPIAADDVIIPNTANISLDNATTINSLNVQAGGILNLGTTGNAMPTVTGTKTFAATSTVNYDANGDQNVTAETYGNLTFTRTTGNRNRVLLAGTHTIAGNLTINANTRWIGNTNNPTVNFGGNITQSGTFTAGTGMYTFNGTGTQTISAAVTITNVTITNTSAQGLSLALTHTFTNLTLNAGAVMSLAGTTTTFPTNTTFTANATSTVRYVGTGAQTVAVKNYGNLLIDATGQTKTPAAGTIGVSGALTVTTGTIWAGNTNDPTLNVTGNLDISGTFATGANPETVGGDLILGAAATLNLERTGTAMPTVTGAKTFNATSTVNYLLNGNQTIAATTYGNLTLSGGGNKTPEAGTFNIVGTYNLAAGTWVGTTNNPTVNFGGNITRVGTFNSGTGMHTFNGTGTQTISAAITITNTTITNASAQGLSLTATHVFTNLTMNANSVLSLAGTTTAFPTNTTFTADATSTVRYVGTGAQTVVVKNYGNLEVNANTTTKTPAAGTINIAGNFTVAAGTTWAGNTNNPIVNLSGNFTEAGTFTSGTGMFTFNGATTQTISATTAITNVTITNASTQGLSLTATQTFTNLTLNAGAVLTLAGTTTPFPTNTTQNLNATSTVRFMGSGAQTIPAYTYGNLETGTGGNKTPAAGTLTIVGDLTVGVSSTWVGTTNNPVVNLAGDFVNAGTFNSGTGVFTFNGTTAQAFTGATTFTNVTIFSSAPLPDPVVNMNNDLTVSGTLTITFGGFVTGSNKVVILSGASIAGASAGTGWIIGNLQKFIPAGASTVTFEVGTLGIAAPNLAYTPVSLSFTGVGGAGGGLLVSAELNDHPQISTSGLDSAFTVNRWWNVTTTGVAGTALPAFTNYSGTFNFVAADLDGGVDTNNTFPGTWNGSVWTSQTVGARTATSLQVTGVTALREYAIGQSAPLTLTQVAATYSDPISGLTNPKSIPGANKQYTLQLSNPGIATSTNTVVVSQARPNDSSFYVNDIGGGGSGPVLFTQGTPSSALTYTFTSLGSGADNIDFSNDSGATWTYTPVPGGNGCDPAVTNIRIRPQGAFASGQSASPAPNFQLEYRTCIN